MKVISCNVNGLRAAYKKGLFHFIKQENPDIFCFQEIKANEVDIPQEMLQLNNYTYFFNSANKKGYGGVAVFTKEKPIATKRNLGLKRFDEEGRLLELSFSKFTLLNLYIPHGGRKKENLEYKLEVYKKLQSRLTKLKGRDVVLIGDFNIAHTEIDLARPRQNKNNIMFTPEERSQLDDLLCLGFVDSFRQFNKEPGNFTWWPYAFNARERNLGWRIDYSFVSSNLSNKITKASIYSKENFSDHCPLGVEL